MFLKKKRMGNRSFCSLRVQQWGISSTNHIISVIALQVMKDTTTRFIKSKKEQLYQGATYSDYNKQKEKPMHKNKCFILGINIKREKLEL